MLSVSHPFLALICLLALLLQLQLLQLCSARIFERCELAAQLRQHGLAADQVATLVCIAQHSSELNTAAFGGGSGPGGGSHGLFQISDVYWCSPPGQGAGCGLSCARLRDDDIADDVQCVRKIFAEHQRISGDGFSAWQAYSAYCRQDAASYVAGCGQGYGSYPQQSQQQQQQQVKVSYLHQHQQQHQQALAPVRAQGKIYSRCELAQELFYQHKLPMQQIPTWVCIAQHESSYNTAAVGRLNADGSADHGLFQISDLFWCTHDQRGGKGCHAACNQFLDSSIADDVQCIRRIHQEHTQISGDGFTAWTVYNRDCRNQRYEQVAACFAKPPLTPSATHPNAIGGSVTKLSYPFGQPQLQTTPNPYYRPAAHKLISYQTTQAVSSYQGNPFLRPSQIQPHPNAIGTPVKSHFANVYGSSAANPLLSHKQHTTQYKQQQHYPYQQQQQQQQHYYTTPLRAGKVYKRCELAQELYFSHKFPMQDIATWVCIAEHESRLDTAAVGRLNADGSADHGLFQISDLYWCTHGGGVGGKGCHIDCDRLLDSDISDDVNCIRTIHEEHTRISGDGFTAWTVYNGHCRDRSRAEIASCFESKELEKEPATPAKPASNELVRKPKPPGKIYQRCELAQELYYKHKLPMQQIPTWVCIAQHESSYNTAAVGRLNADGSEDHGLFQISDLYWCTHDEGGGKACHIECDSLLDSDITDDVQCIRTIHEEHTRLSGDGFNAWTVYNGHCRHQSLAQLSDCFAGNEISEPEEPNHYGAHTQVQAQPQQPVVKIAANHDYGANPFLQRLSASQAPKKATPAVQVRTTVQPVKHVAVVPNHPFGSNPFLQQLKPLQQPQSSASNDRPITFVDEAPVSKHSYDHNPFLKPSNTPTANSIQSSAPIKPSSQSNHSPAYVSNPFLSLVSKPSISKPNINTTPGPTVPPKATHHPYISSDSFRQEIIKFTATSSATTAFNYDRQSTQSPKTTAITTKPTTTHKTTTRPFTTARPFTITWPPTTTKTTTRSPTTKITTTTTRSPLTTRQTTTQTTTQPIRTQSQTSRQTTISTTRQTTTRPTTRQTTTRSTTRQTTTRPTTRQTTTRSTTRQTTTRSTTRQTTTKPTTRQTTTAARTSTSYTTTKATTRPTTTRSTTRQTTTRSTTRQTTTRPTTRQTTTRPTTRQTTTTARNSTTTTRATTRPTTTRATTRSTTTRATIRPTIRAITQPTTTRVTTLSTTRPTTRPTTRATTTKPTTRSTTPWKPFTTSWFSTTPQTTTRYPATTTTARPRAPTTYKTTTRSPATTRPSTTKWPQSAALRSSTSTTPRPYLFTTTTTTTTTRRPATTAKSATTANPFDHPFFAKFKATFAPNRTSFPAITKPTTTSQLFNQSKFTASPYYAKFQENSVKVAAKTAYAYDFGQNRTTTTIRPYSTAKTTTKTVDNKRDLHLRSSKN